MSIKLVFIAIMFDLYKYAQFILHTLANLSFFDFSLILGIQYYLKGRICKAASLWVLISSKACPSNDYDIQIQCLGLGY